MLDSQIRPLRRVNIGAWRSRDGRWTFLRHWGDPTPHRWFAYVDDDEYPSNEGIGHSTLRAVAEWAASDDLIVREAVRRG